MTEEREFGWRWGSNQNRDTVIASFPRHSGDLILSAAGFDIDTRSEITVVLNGESIGNLSKGPNNGLNTPDTFTIPASVQQNTNIVEFRQSNSGWLWGVTNVLLTANNPTNPATDIQLVLNATETREFGWRWGSNQNRDTVTASFPQHSDDLTLSVTGYDIDTRSEIAVILNGNVIGHLSVGPNNVLNASNTFTITAGDQQPMNLVEFQQSNSGWIWGITDIGIN